MTPEHQLDPVSARLLGVLVEKELTTPDQYPLTLNALVNGANQRSNRDPVLALTEAEVRVAADGLIVKHLAGGVTVSGSRVPRYRHTAAVGLGLSVPALVVLTELVLRGPQTVGELRTHARRMHALESLDEVHRLLDSLRSKDLVREVPPAPGSRAPRYQELLRAPAPLEEPPAPSPEPRAQETETATATAAPPALEERVRHLEEEVAGLKSELLELKRALGEST